MGYKRPTLFSLYKRKGRPFTGAGQQLGSPTAAIGSQLSMNDMTNQQKITFDSRTTEVVVRKKTGNRLKTPFSAIGPISNQSRSKQMRPDVFDLLEEVSKGAFAVFNNLKFNRSEDTNISRYTPTEEMSSTDKQTLSRKLSELKRVGLIRRVKKTIKRDANSTYNFKDPRKVFIINPELLRCRDTDEADFLWEACE